MNKDWVQRQIKPDCVVKFFKGGGQFVVLFVADEIAHSLIDDLPVSLDLDYIADAFWDGRCSIQQPGFVHTL